jgi:hypothetical protein
MPEPIVMKRGTYIMAPEPTSKACFINSPITLCQYVYVPRQRLAKSVTAAKNIHATMKELFGSSFSMLSMSYQKKVGDQFFPEFLVSIYIPRLNIYPLLRF